MKNIFVTAIDTDSGKTLVSAILCEALGAHYWKPIQAGYPRDTETVESLVSNPAFKSYKETYLLNTPASPHAAAKIDGVKISVDDFMLPSQAPTIIEGAGGCMVPINDQEFVIDLAAKLPCEIVLVADLYLGSINHTLLTVQLLKNRKLPVKGIIFNGPRNGESERIILLHSSWPCLLRIEKETTIDKTTVSRYAKEILKKPGMSSLLDDDLENIWHPFSPITGEPPIVVTSAKGIYLHCEDGRKIIDGVSSWWVNVHGHSHPHIAEAIYKQAKQLEHVIFAGFTHPPAIQLSKNLLGILPSNQAKIFFSDNGSTAVEVALKMAIQYWHNKGTPKRRVVAIEGAYHGDTFGSMSVGDRGLFTEPFSKHLFDTEFIPFPDGTNNNQVIEKFAEIVKGGDICAFIYEPVVQGAAGMRIYSSEVLSALIKVAKDAKVLCIADEVFTGFGRTGRLFASEYMNAQPDIMALSKGLTGGTMALGVTACSSEIFKAFQSNTFYHGHSFTANPIACASANASFDLLMTEECREQIKAISAAQRSFADKLRRHPKVKNAGSLGTILSLEVKTEGTTSYTNSLKHQIYSFFLERNILLRPLGNVIYFLPSYAFTADEMVIVHNAMDDFLESR